MINPLEDPRFYNSQLRDYNFDLARWQMQVDDVRSARISEESATVRGRIESPPHIPTLAYDGSPEERRAHEVGLEALAHGQVASLVLNGGLATRFGGAVKGIVEVFDSKSFLALKAEDARLAAAQLGGTVPLVLLNSFSTASLTRAHFEENSNFGLRKEDIVYINQTISVRLDLDGNPFFGADGAPRYYAPGHGEFFDVLIASGAREHLLSRGVKWFTFSNVDNLGATLDPVIIGKHILSQKDMTVEVIEKRRNPQGQFDVGGSPVLLDGRLAVVEGFRFPKELAQDSLRDFQTNNMIFSLEALSQPLDLPRYLVNKTVDGRPSLAFEAISCEASSKTWADGSQALSLGLLRVPREGTHGRFFPVKSKPDLEALRGTLRDRLTAGWSARAEALKAR